MSVKVAVKIEIFVSTTRTTTATHSYPGKLVTYIELNCSLWFVEFSW